MFFTLDYPNLYLFVSFILVFMCSCSWIIFCICSECSRMSFMKAKLNGMNYDKFRKKITHFEKLNICIWLNQIIIDSKYLKNLKLKNKNAIYYSFQSWESQNESFLLSLHYYFLLFSRPRSYDIEWSVAIINCWFFSLELFELLKSILYVYGTMPLMQKRNFLNSLIPWTLCYVHLFMFFELLLRDRQKKKFLKNTFPPQLFKLIVLHLKKPKIVFILFSNPNWAV